MSRAFMFAGEAGVPALAVERSGSVIAAVVGPAHQSPFKVPVQVEAYCAQLEMPGSKEKAFGGDDPGRVAGFADRLSSGGAE